MQIVVNSHKGFALHVTLIPEYYSPCLHMGHNVCYTLTYAKQLSLKGMLSNLSDFTMQLVFCLFEDT